MQLAAWPIDGYPQTGIRRLEEQRLIAAGELKGTRQPPGGLWPTEAVDIRLTSRPDFTLPPVDKVLAGQIVELLGDKADRYGVAVLDLSDPNQPAYAEYRGDYHQNVGSVGKLLAALGFFQALADAYPDDCAKARAPAAQYGGNRRPVLPTVIITPYVCSTWIPAPWCGAPWQDGDTGNLWEYLDWTLSVSSNSAAAMTMRDSMLLRQFGTDYPVPDAQITPFFDNTPAADKTALFQETRSGNR